MAPVEGQAGSSIFEGWDKWQIALVVGAPVCLGLAGLWYYTRDRNSEDATDEAKPPTAEKSTSPNASTASNEEPAEETPLDKAQHAKNKGNKYFKGGRYDEAIKCYKEALELCPPEHNAAISTFYANMAAAYEKLKNPQKVIEYCTEAIKLNGKYAKALTRRANAAEQTGNLTLSLEDVTALCILEGFQNQSTLQMADRVLKRLGQVKAKEALKGKKPHMPSRHFLKSYMASFTQDPVQKCFLPGQEAEPLQMNIKPDNPANENELEPEEPVEQTETDAEKISNVADDQSKDVQEDNQSGDLEKDSVAQSKELNGDQSNQLNDAREANIEAIEADCDFKTAVEKLRASEFDEIIPLCTKELAVSPPSHYRQLALLLRGTMFCLTSQSDLALTDLNDVLQEEDLDKKIQVNALIKRGGLHITRENQTEGLADFAHAARIDPNNSDIYHHRGHQNIQLDRLEDAVKDFDNSISKNPDFPISYIQKSYAEHRRAAAEQSTAKLQKAIQSYEATLKKFPQCADGHALYAQALCDLGRFDDADNEFKTAIKLEPDNATSLVHRALLTLQWKHTMDEPIKLIEQAIKLDDKCEYAYEILGTIEVQRGNMMKAIPLFEHAIDLCQTEAEMSQVFSLLHAAQAQLKAVETLGIPLPPGMMG